MDNLIQKSVFIVIGAILLFVSYVFWSPGTFGLCQNVINHTHWLFGLVYWCELNFLGDDRTIILNLGLVSFVFFALSTFFNLQQFKIFRNLFLIGLLVTTLYIYFFPNYDVAFGATFEITHRTKYASYALAIYSAIVYVYALIKGKAQKAR